MKHVILALVYTIVGFVGCYAFLQVVSPPASTKSIHIETQTGLRTEVFASNSYLGTAPTTLDLESASATVRLYPSPAPQGLNVILTVRGRELAVAIEPKRYRAMISAVPGTDALFEVRSDPNGEMVGSCEGDQCEIELPGPGDYVMEREVCREDSGCTRSTKPFSLGERVDVVVVPW